MTCRVELLILNQYSEKARRHGFTESGDIEFFIFSRDNEIKVSRNLILGVLLPQVTTLTTFMAIDNAITMANFVIISIAEVVM